MLYVVITFLALSIILYFLLGGADFGAGIIELFTSQKNRGRTRKALYRAIGPVWEANHMWLIIAIVILFVGFPVMYTTMSVYLHIPLLIMLLGIIARGTAFVFRHYDAVKDEMQWLYNRIFVYSSFITPLFLGVLAGSLISGRINPDADSFAGAYIAGWLHPFSFAVGFFTVALCGFLAAIYLIGEANNAEDRRRFIIKARHMLIAAWLLGGLVFLTARLEAIPLQEWVFGNVPGLTAVILASLSLILLWYLLLRGKTQVLRVLAGFQVCMILFAVSYAHFPDFIIMQGGLTLSLFEHYSAPAIRGLGWALLLGSVLILPFLFYLFYSFQKKEE
ncbi:cytochrome bd-I ubiquinol oxidase subunit 2 apoprotein [Anseongella ginsenosidimutans]|uniref:Cytochrome bd-I ubiquinol oxidase subunit 2 apoprotein n=1 Tax=Anseongella ginsenosidimutans TaxID=496056 RepID=A0A4V2UTQ7_9SPHI|nr:cytochrome d ubiquinol oxidase subunit II [Anseongella ginsenosidimutans]QEC52885.1 cytochrome d ubiquinol oxidase subunit II [Anseongella ginsenosidimutans]TCS87276.1 cytochrome bd-I ubiquinol oxidase subunit 2 apoprotein [Anseongella ginsenosidimutans]